MVHATQTWSFGDPTGWSIACVLFLLWSGVIGFGMYGISYRRATMGSLNLEERPSALTSVMLGIIIAVAIFSILYFTTLSGFSELRLEDGHLMIRYILPERTIALSFDEVINVQEEPAYKSRWRLVLETETSGTYESALTSRQDVHRAGDVLRQQMAQNR